MKKSQLSMKWLEVFLLTARSGSIQKAASEAQLSISTVSHHLRSLEDTLGVALLDHSRRPMRITPIGATFLQNIDEAMRLIRKAQTEAQSGTLHETRNLTLSIVEDFDSEIAPELARILAIAMPRCQFQHQTRPSHETLSRILSQDVDIGIATQPQFSQPGLIEIPLLRDPFVLAIPTGHDQVPEDLLNGASTLPLLRYSSEEIMGTQIEAQLRRLRLSIPNRFEFNSNQSIMTMVAEGNGWAITTPTNFIRSHRFHRQITLPPFPGKGFARYLSVYRSEMSEGPLAETIANTVRELIKTRAVDPVTSQMPWLAPIFRTLQHNTTVT